MNNPFYEEWRACLRSHYTFVLEVGDHVTEPSLRGVLFETGFTESEVFTLQAEVLGLAQAAPDSALISDGQGANNTGDPAAVEVPVLESVPQSEAVAPTLAPEPALEPGPVDASADLLEADTPTASNAAEEETSAPPIRDVQQLSLF